MVRTRILQIFLPCIQCLYTACNILYCYGCDEYWDSSGKFATTEEEARLENFSFRVPATLKNEVKRVAGKKTAQWLREAIAEKLAREK